MNCNTTHYRANSSSVPGDPTINGDRASGIYHHPELLWLICPLLLYWISRIWMLAHRGQLDDDPVLFAIRDPTSYVVGGLIVAVLMLARM